MNVQQYIMTHLYSYPNIEYGTPSIIRTPVCNPLKKVSVK